MRDDLRGRLLWSLAPVAIIVAIFGWLTLEVTKSEARARQLKGELADLQRKPATPEGWLDHFIQNCGDSSMPFDLTKIPKEKRSCRTVSGYSQGPVLICGFPYPYPDQGVDGILVCDSTGCSWSIRNGAGP